ncbi:hypothetical protein BDY21DRAFT_325029 [Lineolata rhizophorae]|uniref:Amino-acid acetyltransferase, mitochondrial n=1 Tax=Lineolata rhizophorae TaxID=578093 RepID=A0A6A6NTN6_9PEZI|nr:hypothetical protein BDY21DRAFT_325029 [Lineolata rhizophorae]
MRPPRPNRPQSRRPFTTTSPANNNNSNSNSSSNNTNNTTTTTAKDTPAPAPARRPGRRDPAGPGQARKLAERDFFLSVLSTAATKRDAKQYLSRFGAAAAPPRAGPAVPGVPVEAEASPVPPQLHVALVKLRAPQLLPDETLDGVALTLAQLARLGLGCVIVVDFDADGGEEERRRGRDGADRIAAAIRRHGPVGARRVDNALGLVAERGDAGKEGKTRVDLAFRDMLMSPLRMGTLPVLTPIAFTQAQAAKRVQADDIVVALSREFAAMGAGPGPQPPPPPPAKVSLDRVILLDPLGGIPAENRADGVHVFLNMEQEYADWETPPLAREASPSLPPPGSAAATRHCRNLDTMRAALALLPATSSALLVTPAEAAVSATFASNAAAAAAAAAAVAPGPGQNPSSSSGVGTRPNKNPLIHNLLTDKPPVSSSLPRARLVAAAPATAPPPATFAKKGMPLAIIPDPRVAPWTPPVGGAPLLSLRDPRIDLERLVALIEDSFGRRLDVEHYLRRVEGRLAGVIVAGEYDGGAILTWESPPPSSPPRRPGRRSPRPPVPYLDKFAVRKRAQGAGGVADVVFKAMVRACFPGGVVWRSRQTNPVNRWYFERAAGQYKLPGGLWTMFWTTEGVGEGIAKGGAGAGGEVAAEGMRWRERWRDYVGVCEGVVPSWADDTGVVD